MLNIILCFAIFICVFGVEANILESDEPCYRCECHVADCDSNVADTCTDGYCGPFWISRDNPDLGKLNIPEKKSAKAVSEVVRIESITEDCLRCICNTVSGCTLKKRCKNDRTECGPFRISKSFWEKAGKSTTHSLIDPMFPGAFQSCATNLECATKTVKNFMRQYAQDCNKDGVIDCYDYLAILMQGTEQCYKELTTDDTMALEECMAVVSDENVVVNKVY